MKKSLIACASVLIFGIASNAQTSSATKIVGKETKEKLKANPHTQELLKQKGLFDPQVSPLKERIKNFSITTIDLKENIELYIREKGENEEAKLKQKNEEETDQMLKQIGLTDAQATQFKEVTKTYATKGSEIKKDASLTDAQKEEKLKANMQEKKAKLTEVIGADKLKEYNKLHKAAAEVQTPKQ